MMNRDEFLSQLRRALEGLSQADIEDVIQYYEEMIIDKAADQGVDEEDVIAGLGPVADIAKGVRASVAPEAAAQSQPADDLGNKVLTAQADQVRSLVIEAANAPLVITSGAMDTVELRYTETARMRYDVSHNDKELRLIQRPLPKLLPILFGRVYPIEVLLPADFAGKADLSTGNGPITWEGVSLWGQLTLTTSNGTITLRNCQAKGITLRSSNASLRAHAASAQESIALHTSNGPIKAEGLSGTDITLHTSNGSIQCMGIAAQDITFKTSNGPIGGALPGRASEYTVTSSTSNASNSLRDHQHAGPKRLNAHTSNGSIRLHFAQDE